MRLFLLIMALAAVVALTYAATVAQNTSWYNQNANVTYVMPATFNATSLGFTGNTFWIYNSTMNPDGYINLSFTTPYYLKLNLTALTAGRSAGVPTLYPSYTDRNHTLSLPLTVFNSAADEGEFTPIVRDNKAEFNITLNNATTRPWWQVNYSVNGVQYDARTAQLIDSGGGTASFNTSLGEWQGIRYTATQDVYLYGVELQLSSSTAGSRQAPVYVINASNYDVLGALTGRFTFNQSAQVLGFNHVELRNGSTYYILVFTNFTSGIAYGTADGSTCVAYGNLTLSSISYDCALGTPYFKLYTLTEAPVSAELAHGENNITVTTVESRKNIYSDICTPANGCVLYLSMDEGNTSWVRDLSGNGYDGKLVDYNVSDENGEWLPVKVAGIFGGAYSSDGLYNGIEVEKTPLTYRNLTIVGHFYLRNQSVLSFSRHNDYIRQGPSFSISSDSADERDLRILVGYNQSSATYKWIYLDTNLAYKWNFFSVTYVWDDTTNRTYVKFFVNDEKLIDAWYDEIVYKDTTVALRVLSGSGGTLNGSADEVMLFNRTLSDTEILQIFNRTYSRYYTSFKAVMDNSSYYEGVWNTIYSNGTVVRNAMLQDGTFRNASSFISIVPENSVKWYDTDIYSTGYYLSDFTGNVVVDYSNVGQWYHRLNASGTVTYFNETKHSANEVRFYVSGTGNLNLELTGLYPSWQYSKIVDGQNVGTLVTDASGKLADTVVLSSHEVVYLPVSAAGSGSGGSAGSGGGVAGGGGGGISLVFCPKLNLSIPANEYSEETCGLAPEYKIKRAKIFYVTHDKAKKAVCPFLSLDKLGVSECIERRLKPGKTVYIGGGAFTAAGSIFPENYTWYIDGREVYKAPEFTTVFYREGEHNITLLVIDTLGNRFYDSVIVNVTEEVEIPPSLLGLLFQKLLGKNETEGSNNTVSEIIGNATSRLTNATVNVTLGFWKRLGLSRTEAFAVLIVGLLSAYGAWRLVGAGRRRGM